MDEHTKHLLDGASVAAAFAACVAWLPPIAAFASLVWTCIRIYETKTVGRWLGREAKDED